MKKELRNFKVKSLSKLHGNYGLLKLTPEDGGKIGEVLPGQFVQVRVDNSKSTFLRRPISVNFVDYDNNELWLLVRSAGEGTRHLLETRPGETINLMYPLGNMFTLPRDLNEKILLVGGGVGVAPMLYFGSFLKNRGYNPKFLLGARTSQDVLMLEEFEKYGEVFVSTDDGSLGDKGIVTLNHALGYEWDSIYCCGPAPMMKAIASKAKETDTECEVSLENMMACGLGACLCCVEKTVKGNVCVCTEGPVFNIKDLTW
ncbi:MAG: dihydroorotate dehydrogenase electron transfer subunit [Paramuribaculum sp.]|jgi:dihydroorotate dehydrogenase electron transfer subunit